MNKEGFLALDRRITRRLRLPAPRGAGWRLGVFLAHSGDSWFWAIGLALVWFISGILGSPFWHRSAAILLTSVVIQALAVFALKRGIRRRRPEGDWGGIYRQIDPHSFPSGHATRAMLLVVLAAGLGPAWFAALVAAWAPLMSLARVAIGMHYISDLLGGWLLGLAFGVLALLTAPYWAPWLLFA